MGDIWKKWRRKSISKERAEKNESIKGWGFFQKEKEERKKKKRRKEEEKSGFVDVLTLTRILLRCSGDRSLFSDPCWSLLVTVTSSSSDPPPLPPPLPPAPPFPLPVSALPRLSPLPPLSPSAEATPVKLTWFRRLCCRWMRGEWGTGW